MCHLHFSYWPINIKRPMRMYSDIRYQRLQNLVQMFFHQLFMLISKPAIHNAVTTVWPGLENKACRFHLVQSWWRKIQSLGLGKQGGTKDSEVSQFLKKIFGLSLLPTAEVSDRFALDVVSNLPNDKRVEQFCD